MVVNNSIHGWSMGDNAVINAALSHSIDEGVKTAAETVKELARSIKESSKSVNISLHSYDGVRMVSQLTTNIGGAVRDLSEKWNLAVNTADLENVGASAAKYLSDAIQNVNINVSIDNNFLVAIKYSSIAVCLMCICSTKNYKNKSQTQTKRKSLHPSLKITQSNFNLGKKSFFDRVFKI